MKRNFILLIALSFLTGCGVNEEAIFNEYKSLNDPSFSDVDRKKLCTEVSSAKYDEIDSNDRIDLKEKRRLKSEVMTEENKCYKESELKLEEDKKQYEQDYKKILDKYGIKTCDMNRILCNHGYSGRCGNVC